MNLKTTLLIGFIGIKFLLQYLVLSPEYELHRDEYLHLDQANHLAWGYLSVPPFTSWTSYIIQMLGNSIFWIKFFPALYGALTIYLVWKAIEELNGGLFAMILGATCVLFSAIMRMNISYQPNSFDVLCWTALYYFTFKYAKSENSNWLFPAAVIFALGFLNKYNIAFQMIGLFPAFLITEQRKIFSQPKLYIAAIAALLIILPNLIWQYRNDFPVINHLRELSETQLANVSRMVFLKSQLLFFVGSLWVILTSLYALLFYKPFKPYRFFLWSILFTLIAFIYFRAKGYYAIGVYPIYIAFGSVFIGEKVKTARLRYLQPICLAIPILLFLPVFNVLFPDKSPEYIIEHSETYKKFGLLQWEDGKDHELPQDFADMLGWKELAYKVDSAYLSFPAKQHTLILCDNYGQAGAINYYSRRNVKAVSFNADYINWFDLSRRYENLIRIKENGDNHSEIQEISKLFATSKVFETVTNKYAREYGATIYTFSHAKVDIRKMIMEEINERSIAP